MEPEEETTISVLDPITPAVGRTKLMLFAPFSVRKWLLVGLFAWLAQLSLGGRLLLERIFGKMPEPTTESYLEIIQNYEQWLTENLPNIEQWLTNKSDQYLPMLIGAAIGTAILSLVLLWIRSRGHFLVLNSVARNEVKLKESWLTFAPQGNSLFLFRILMTGLLGLTTLPFVSVLFYQFYQIAMTGELTGGRVMVGLACVLTAGFFSLLITVINKLTNDFVTPIMVLRKLRCRAAWGEFRRLLFQRKGAFIVYLLFQILLQGVLGIGMLILQGMLGVIFLIAIPNFIGLVTLPFLGVLIVLPILIFDRAYSLHYLALFGKEYDLIGPAKNTSAGPPAIPPTPQAST